MHVVHDAFNDHPFDHGDDEDDQDDEDVLAELVEKGFVELVENDEDHGQVVMRDGRPVAQIKKGRAPHGSNLEVDDEGRINHLPQQRRSNRAGAVLPRHSIKPKEGHMSNAPIVKIGIHDSGVRVALVREPDSGHYRTHGLGTVGEPLLGFLGHRSEGYTIVLPLDRRDLYVYKINWDAAPNAKGRYPEIRLPWEALDTPDVPTLEPFADEEIGVSK